MEGEKGKCWRRTYTFLNRRGEKDGSLDRQGVWTDRGVGQTGCFPGKVSGVVINLELGFGVSFSSRLSKCIGCIKREVQGCC